jgi:hypothetical protein
MKQELAPITAKAVNEESKRPSLLMTREEGCEPPQKLEYKAGEPIEELCRRSTPYQMTASESVH